jgi:hypothetical protein
MALNAFNDGNTAVPDDSIANGPLTPSTGLHQDVARLLSSMLNNTFKQINPKASGASLPSFDVALSNALVERALMYKHHLSVPDAISVAYMTSEDIRELQRLVTTMQDGDRLDDVLARANDMLNQENVRFSFVGNQLWLGRRDSQESDYYLSARIISYAEVNQITAD